MSEVGDNPWVPAPWMDPYLESMGGRAEVVRLLSGPRALVQINSPLALMQQGMEEQLVLIRKLYRSGLLKEKT